MSEPSLEFGLALHCGDVMYGNIGVAERFQFTVIGAAANEAARLAGLCKTLSQPVLMSSHRLRGVEQPQEIFALADSRMARARSAHPVKTAD
jgi:adenylate cyclase